MNLALIPIGVVPFMGMLVTLALMVTDDGAYFLVGGVA